MNNKRITAVLLAAAMALGLCACGKPKAPESFSDVDADAWYAPYVEEARSSGIALGYEDGTFRPANYITAGEFVTMLAKANGADPKKFEARHWSFVYWQYLDQYNVFDNSRVTDLRTSLCAAITRQEAALVIYNAMVNMLGEETVPTHDPAANIPGYIALDTQYLLPVAELYAKGILCGYNDLEFDGNCKLTRAEAAALIISLFDTSKRHVAVPTRNVTYTSLGTFSDSTLFIGDSLTYQLIENYLLPNKFIGGASYMAAPCTTAKYFLSSYWVLTPSEDNRYGVACNTEFQDLSFGDALAVNKGKYDTVFFLLGSNNSSYVTRNQYLDAIDLILRYNPDATIYLQTVPNSPTGAVETERVNGLVREAVSAMNADGSDNIKLLDTNSVWNSACIADDGVHLTALGLDAWYRYIRTDATK